MRLSRSHQQRRNPESALSINQQPWHKEGRGRTRHSHIKINLPNNLHSGLRQEPFHIRRLDQLACSHRHMPIRYVSLTKHTCLPHTNLPTSNRMPRLPQFQTPRWTLRSSNIPIARYRRTRWVLWYFTFHPFPSPSPQSLIISQASASKPPPPPTGLAPAFSKAPKASTPLTSR